MTKLPEEGEPLPPLLEAIQQLKYDPEQNTTEGIQYTLINSFNMKFFSNLKLFLYRIGSGTQGIWEFQFQTEEISICHCQLYGRSETEMR